jgi:hypothetical protein
METPTNNCKDKNRTWMTRVLWQHLQKPTFFFSGTGLNREFLVTEKMGTHAWQNLNKLVQGRQSNKKSAGLAGPPALSE